MQALGYDIWPSSRARAGLNPPLQKGEAFGMPGFIEMLRFQFQISSFSQQQRPLLHYYQTAKLLQKLKFPKIKPGA